MDGDVAPMVERDVEAVGVGGSSPSISTIKQNQAMINISHDVLKELEERSQSLDVYGAGSFGGEDYDEDYNDDPYETRDYENDMSGDSVLYALGKNADGVITTALQLKKNHDGCAFCPGIFGHGL